MTLGPWKSGHLLVWDATCPDNFAPSYRAHATQGPGKVAAAAEEKGEKYSSLPSSHWFSPIAIETMGAVGGPKSMALLKDVGHRIVVETGDPRARYYLFQCLSVAV